MLSCLYSVFQRWTNVFPEVFSFLTEWCLCLCSVSVSRRICILFLSPSTWRTRSSLAFPCTYFDMFFKLWKNVEVYKKKIIHLCMLDRKNHLTESSILLILLIIAAKTVLMIKLLFWFCDSQRKTSDWHVVQWRCDWWICYDQHQWCGESAGVCVSCECGFSFLQTHTKMSFIWGYLAQISLAGCSLNSKPHFLSLMLTKAAFVLLKIQ